MTNKYDKYFQVYAAIYFHGMNAWPWLKALTFVESTFRPDIISKDGAVGLMQLMPNTAKAEAKSLQIYPDLHDPQTNIHLGTRHLRRMWDIFGREKGIERLRFALGAYNAGQKNIIDAQDVAHAAGLPTDKWSSIEAVLSQVTGDDDAPETINHVRKVEAARLAMIEA